MNRKKILLCQPHSDDVLFSASHYLFNPDKYEVQVLTVENNPKRILEDTKLYEFLGIKFHHLTTELDDNSYYGYYKEFTKMSDADSAPFLIGHYGQEFLDSLKEELLTFIKKFLKKNPDYEVAAPLGIGHPFHYWVFSVLESSGIADYFYREFPHSYKRKGKLNMEERLTNLKISESIPVEEFEEIKWKLASKFYKTQSGLLFFEKGYIDKHLPEEIYKRR